MAASFSGVQLRTVFADRGIVTWQHIEQTCRKGNDHRAGTGLITLENTHNMAGGTVTPVDIYQDIWWRATELRLPVHLDGAASSTPPPPSTSPSPSSPLALPA